MDAIATQLSWKLHEIEIYSEQLSKVGYIPFQNLQRLSALTNLTECSDFVTKAINFAKKNNFDGIVLFGTISRYLTGTATHKSGYYRHEPDTTVYPIGQIRLSNIDRLRLVKSAIKSQLEALQNEFNIFIVQSLPSGNDSNIGTFTKLVVSNTLDFSSAKIDVSVLKQFNLEEQMLFEKYLLPNPTSKIFYIKTSDEVCEKN